MISKIAKLAELKKLEKTSRRDYSGLVLKMGNCDNKIAKEAYSESVYHCSLNKNNLGRRIAELMVEIKEDGKRK